jgi:GAF domain-containing protein
MPRGTVYKRESRIQSFFGSTGEDGSAGEELMSLFEATKRITNEIVPQRVNEVIVDEVCNILHCARSGLYVASERNSTFQLTRSDKRGAPKVVPFGKGLCGYVHESKKGFAAGDMKDDKMAGIYSQQYDLPTFDGRAICVHPIIDYDEECLGVLAVTGSAPFSERQRLLLHQVSQYCAIAIRNAMVYREAIMQHERANGLLNVAKTLGQNLDMKTTISTISSNAAKLVHAERCCLYVCNYKDQVLWSYDDAKEFKVDMKAGLLGQVVSSQKVMNIADAYEVPGFDKSADLRTGSRTKSLLYVPVMSQVGTQILGVLELLNKREIDGTQGEFEADEEELMVTFANYVSSEIESSGFLQRAGKTK